MFYTLEFSLFSFPNSFCTLYFTQRSRSDHREEEEEEEEKMAHSRQPNKAAVTLSNKSNNNGTFSSSKTLYDDVYGGPPKFGVSTLSPRFEDYREIFGSFHTARASSIPLLDLPAVHDAEAFFDPRSHSFNYTEVFGALDFELPSDNLFHRHTALDAASSEESWSPEETDSFSEELDQSAINQSILNGSIFHSVDGNVGSNILYHNKVDGTSNEHMSKGKNHLSQLHAAPGFGRVYDETTQLHQTNSSYQVADDIDLDMEFSAENVKGNHPRATTVAHLGNFTFGEQTFDSDLNLQNGGSKKDSHSGEMFITVSDINLRSMPSQVPPPSRPPPVVDAKKDMCGLHSNSRVVASEETSGAVSPPFFDAEDHMNSSVTASADAMNEAMLIAEEKLRSTKELKGRKKWNRETYLKSNYDAKVNEAKMCKDITRLSSLNDETALGSYDWRHSKAKLYATDDRQELKKASPETTDNLEGKRAVNMFEEKNKMESRSSLESDRSTEVGTWKDESEFFELVGMKESEMVTQTAKQSKNLMQGIGAQKHGQKEREASNVQEKHKQVKATEENFQVEEYEKKYKATKEAREHDENIMKPEASNGKQRQREHIEREKMAKVFEEEENEKSIKIAHQHGKSEKKVTEADQSAIMEDVCEMGNREHKQAEIQKSIEVDRQTANDIQQATGLRENQKKLREVEKQQQNVNRHKHSEKMEENRKTQSEAFAIGQTDQEEKLKGSGKLEDIVERSNAAVESDYTEETEVCKSENQMKLKLGKRIQMNKGLKEARERVEIEKSLKSSFENEESDGGVLPAFRWDENGKKLKEDIELEVKEIRLKEASEQRENKAYEKDQSTKKFEDFYDGDGEGNIPPKSGDGKGIQKVMNQTPVQEQINRMLSEDQKKKVTESTSSQTFASEGNVAVSNENRHLEQSENMNKDGEMEKCKGLNKDLDDKERKDGGKMKNAEVTDETWEIESGEDLSTQSASMHEAFIRKPKVSKDYVAKMRTECKVGEKQLKGVGMENQLDNEKFSAPEQMTAGDAEHSKTQSEKEEDTVTKVDCRRSTEAAEPIVQETVNAQKTAQLFHIGQSTESKTKSINEKSAIIKDTERMKRERESEKDHLRKMEEEVDREREREKEVEKAVLEAEREREREKDRMAVDRATFEARDRAYAEACEREERAAFERATMEARYKALAEARERLEKACAEARDKSYIDKETTEARLKAERAAVERATAEAQDRALEKLKSERTAFESRERLERSVSDNFCGRQDSSSSDMLDPQFQNSSSSTVSRHPYSLYGAASFSERSEREGESPQRCRARLERHRRTAERAAKALAEKNMRDLLAQKEQAERNRLSETLDAEVRRWSGGKEGNLRALLSTLQYILWPDSGWQSIPLTEVITSAAVKKAYRKATLCVHPDKLQQRGASIQQKYICEKVFDLLKEAWNKFNSEER